jgi:hypothetical protein
MRRLALLLLLTPLFAGFTLTWENPAVNEDGSPIDDLATIRVYQSPVSGAYGDPLAEIAADGPGLTQSYAGANPERGRLFWVVRACDSSGNCSAPSNEASHDFLDVKAPAAPAGLSVVP